MVHAASGASLIDVEDAHRLIQAVESDTGANVSVVRVDGQPFDHAVRVEVTKPTDPAWAAQVLSSASDADVKAGDRVVGSYYIRAESIDGSEPDVPVLGQKIVGPYELLFEQTGDPGSAWVKKDFEFVASKDYPAGSINVVFHLGRVPQTVEIGAVRVEVEPDEAAAASSDAAGNDYVLINASDASAWIRVAEPGTGASVSLVDVEGQPFTNAVRAEVTQPADPIWAVQALSQGSAEDVAPGDVIVGSYYIRAEPVDGSAPDVAGYFQKMEGQYEQLASLSTRPSPTWTHETFRVVATKDYPAKALTVSFQFGRTPQIVEIGGLKIDVKKK